jgi:hypothetical protein
VIKQSVSDDESLKKFNCNQSTLVQPELTITIPVLLTIRHFWLLSAGFSGSLFQKRKGRRPKSWTQISLDFSGCVGRELRFFKEFAAKFFKVFRAKRRFHRDDRSGVCLLECEVHISVHLFQLNGRVTLHGAQSRMKQGWEIILTGFIRRLLPVPTVVRSHSCFKPLFLAFVGLECRHRCTARD